MAAAIDARSGSVTWLPFTVCCWALSIMEPLDYRRDSQLLVVHGMLNEKGGGTHYYRLTGSKFMLLAIHRRYKGSRCDCASYSLIHNSHPGGGVLTLDEINS